MVKSVSVKEFVEVTFCVEVEVVVDVGAAVVSESKTTVYSIVVKV